MIPDANIAALEGGSGIEEERNGLFSGIGAL